MPVPSPELSGKDGSSSGDPGAGEALCSSDYSEECYQNILEVLVREDRFVEPAPLQIVCERLWRERAKAPDPVLGDGVRVIPLSSLPEGGTRRILDSFFDEVLAAFESSPDRAKALEMLGPLVTADGTRNIVARDSLVKVPFRNAKKRLELLNVLAQVRVVRIEQRLGGQFVEISHEFLISSILAKIREVLDSDPEYWTIQTLEGFRDVQFRMNSSNILRRRGYSRRCTESDIKSIGRRMAGPLN